MANVFYVRHGQSEANGARVFAGGGSDSSLTENGINQAVTVAAKLTIKIELSWLGEK
ncbi:histidine phosphatase family protein [Candidatus Saccharibacteria bacterium]|nr:MAG: histidine phosphatase family protein [Candidatus Saccharibacteria bacterium]